jgi:hypothetical protein
MKVVKEFGLEEKERIVFYFYNILNYIFYYIISINEKLVFSKGSCNYDG